MEDRNLLQEKELDIIHEKQWKLHLHNFHQNLD